jgi:hypothetical protein
MTAETIQSGNAFAFGAANDIREVAMAIVSLLWIIRGGVTVDAAWTRED